MFVVVVVVVVVVVDVDVDVVVVVVVVTLFCERPFSNISSTYTFLSRKLGCRSSTINCGNRSMFMLKTSVVVDPWSFCEVRICPFASRLSGKKRFFNFVIFSGWKKKRNCSMKHKTR